MGIISILAMIIISSGATGMLMSLVWYAFCKIAKNYLHTKAINFSLKIVLISYYIPSMFVALMIRDKVFELQNIIILYFNDIVKISLTVFFTVTIILFIREIKKVYNSYKELGEHCQNRYPADVDIAAKKEELSRKFKVRRDVKIYRCIDITGPFTYGVIRPTIYLPDNDIEDEYLCVLLTHELFHNKQWDFIWKPLSIIVKCVHWINPLAWLVARDIERWAEADCDYKCCTIGGIRQKTYFTYLIKTLEDASETYERITSKFTGSESELIWRCKRMDAENNLKDKKTVEIVAEVCTLALSIIFVMGATNIINKAYIKVYASTADYVDEDKQQLQELYDENIIYLNEFDYEEVSDEKVSIITNLEDLKIIDIDLDCGKYYVSEDINIYESDDIFVSLVMDKQDECINIGILQSDGVIRYISCMENYDYIFKNMKSDLYKIFIFNGSDEEAIFRITYGY